MIEDFEWSVGDRYRSNDGAGPLTARILCVADGFVTMERWRRGRKRAVRFTLPLRFLLSPVCGWRKLAEDKP